MSFDKVPAPFSTDFYADEAEGVRGAVVNNQRVLDISGIPVTLSKIPQPFVSHTAPPLLPADPMYVLPRTRFFVSGWESSAILANSILTALQGLCPQGCNFRTDIPRMKISVEIAGTLDFKVKLFQTTNGQLMVVIRRDSGDWFMFIQLYSAIKKYLRTNAGLTIEAV